MNLHGPVRVAANAGSGAATVTLSFDAWKGVPVAPTTHPITVLPAKPGPQAEPIAPNLIASLAHPERKATFHTVAFSPDGTRLVAAGYPSGIVQFWDVASRKEIRRIDMPAGYRDSPEYAVLAADWKTLYVSIKKETNTPLERDGKRVHRVEYAGEIRVWDVASGKNKDPLPLPAGSAPTYATLAPGGRFLLCIERQSFDTSDTGNTDVTVVWDLAAGKRRKLCDEAALASFAPDGETVAIRPYDSEAGKTAVKLFDLGTRKELATLICPEKDRHFNIGPVSPDGDVLAVYVGGNKGAPLEVWFLDAKTLTERGKLVGKGDSLQNGWSNGVFTPDSKRFVVLDGAGNALVWNVAGQKLERTLPYAASGSTWHLDISPDSKTVAVGWAPPRDPELENASEPDPQDVPQPRVSLIDLAGDAPTRVLVAPHGYSGGLAYSPGGKSLAFGGYGVVHLFDLGMK